MSHSTEHNSRPEQSATLFIAASKGLCAVKMHVKGADDKDGK